MHPLRFLFINLSLASVAFPRPLVITRVQRSPDAGQDHLLPAVPVTEAAPDWVPVVEATANGMLRKMYHVIRNPTTPAHKEIMDASFGPSCLRKNAIKNRIVKMRDATVRVRITPPHTVRPVYFSRPEGTRQDAPRVADAPCVTDSVALSHDDNHVDTAAALIHQTAKYAVHANTYARFTRDGKHNIIPLTLFEHWPTHTIHYPGDQGSTTVNDNQAWKDLRDNTNNMETNADSYRVMAYLCHTHPDLSLVTRALFEGDKEAYHSILHRNDGSCPPNKKNAVLNNASGSDGRTVAT